MRVEFYKKGERQYAVVVLRENLPELRMDPAPGFDPLMPHDMLHFLVEQELGLRRGIFGQLALGGTAGTFHSKPSEKLNSRENSRLRRKTAKRGKKMLKEGSDDCVQSERATYICLYDWLSNSSEANLRSRAEEMKDTAQSILSQMSETERAKLNKDKLGEIRTRMDELSRLWSALKVNQAMILEW
jgi:hypothetical protein